ncbi:ABC transporter substrate-binding protein [Phycisphaera mikurensis]|uniref:Putative ABC transporter substrate binding protein n=1 Tax=Phycisphaera mikurensis (strain NBRC 102666 / KCTC 22515 / FYK2301M01) TaxID=1142394 RepID=I0IG72_PHYMF|nr:ABC transporter substrate-binding protein [Phycisphaera mikurensis]MBB6440357.1 ABC-type Fe3+-hydroxamate transport system substrate-binding protein [Phycisphaera mikurensis]BAM04260.1 putative ABC transporter substrate binding protein [Phycisphaera mikurensis NBRC 102666]
MRATLPDCARPAPGLLVCFFLLLTACGRGPSHGSPETAGGPRIVSLIPAATLTLVGLGLGENVVGVGEHDPAAEALLPRETPRVGSFLDVDAERLAALSPTRVVVPAGTQLRLPAGAELLAQPYPETVEQAAANLEALGAAGDAAAVRAAFAEATPDPGGPRVLLAFGTSPVWASGPGTVNDEVLRAAGGVNALADAAVPALTLDEEALRALAPEVVLLLLPGRDAVAAEAERASLATRLPGTRVAVLVDRFVLLPGPNLVGTLRRFREALAPGAAPGPTMREREGG